MEGKTGKSTIIKFGDVQYLPCLLNFELFGGTLVEETPIHSIIQHRCSYSWEILHHLVPDSSSSRLSWLADSTHVVPDFDTWSYHMEEHVYIYMYALNMKCMYYIICVCLDQCRNTVHVRICLSGLISDYICHMELVGASVITFHRNVRMRTRIDVRTCVG